MSFEIREVSTNCIQCRGTDTIDYDAFIALFEELALRVGVLKNVQLFCDIRGCHSTLDFSEELRLVDLLRENVDLFTQSKWAFVADTELLCSLGQIGGVLVEATNLPLGYAVFRTPEAAADWFGFDDDVRESLIGSDSPPSSDCSDDSGEPVFATNPKAGN